MQPEEAVEIDSALPLRLAGEGWRWWDAIVISLLAVRHHDVEPVGRATLEKYDQTLLARSGSFSRVNSTSKKAGHNAGADYGDCAILQEDSSSYGHLLLLSLRSKPLESDAAGHVQGAPGAAGSVAWTARALVAFCRFASIGNKAAKYIDPSTTSSHALRLRSG